MKHRSSTVIYQFYSSRSFLALCATTAISIISMYLHPLLCLHFIVSHFRYSFRTRKWHAKVYYALGKHFTTVYCDCWYTIAESLGAFCASCSETVWKQFLLIVLATISCKFVSTERYHRDRKWGCTFFWGSIFRKIGLN